jgi:hypothetical protein
MSRRGRLLETIWNTPWLLALVILIVVLGVGLWIWEQVKESKDGDALRERDRRG